MGKMNLSKKILIGLVAGIIVGLLLTSVKDIPFIKTYVIDFALNLVGNIFIRGIRMLVVPLVFFSLILGVAGVDDATKLGRLGVKTICFYLVTTFFAVTLSLFVGNLINPGIGVTMSALKADAITIATTKSFYEILIGMVPINPIEAMVKGDMLAIIVYAILVGLGISLLGKHGEKIKSLVFEINALNLKLVEIVMVIAPLGVFCLIAKMFATLGYSALIPLAKYVSAVIIGLIIMTALVYPMLLKIIGKYSPIKFFKKFYPVMVLAFSTSSSAACLPTSLKTVEEEFGVSNTTASFTLPLGNTINMDGTAIMQGIATIFIAQIYGIDLTMGNYLTIIITATLASIGTAGVPGVGVIMLSMVLTEVGLPIEGIALVMGIDRIVDMFRTVTNVTGDAICTLAIAKTEGDILKN